MSVPETSRRVPPGDAAQRVRAKAASLPPKAGRTKRLASLLAVLPLAAGLLSGCAGTAGQAPDPRAETRLLGPGLPGIAGRAGGPGGVPLAADTASSLTPHMEFGQSEQGTGVAPGRPIAIEPGGKRMSLQFVNTEVQEFIRSVFEEILQEPVIVDPAVAGRISVRTGEPVDRSEAVELVRQMLALNGAELTRDGKVWRVTARPGGGARPAGNVHIAALHNLEPEQARAALQGIGG